MDKMEIMDKMEDQLKDQMEVSKQQLEPLQEEEDQKDHSKFALRPSSKISESKLKK